MTRLYIQRMPHEHKDDVAYEPKNKLGTSPGTLGPPQAPWDLPRDLGTSLGTLAAVALGSPQGPLGPPQGPWDLPRGLGITSGTLGPPQGPWDLLSDLNKPNRPN